MDESRLRVEAIDHFEQLPRRLCGVGLRKPPLGEIELVRAVDQFDGVFNVRLDVVLDPDADIALPEEVGVVRASGSQFVPLSHLEQLVLLQSAEPRIRFTLEPGMTQQKGDGALIDDRHVRHEMFRLVPVQQIVVDEENGRGPQLNRFDEVGESRSLGLPVDLGKDEVVEQSCRLEDGAHGVGIVLRTDRREDFPRGQLLDDRFMFSDEFRSALHQSAAPERIVEVPDDEADILRKRIQRAPYIFRGLAEIRTDPVCASGDGFRCQADEAEPAVAPIVRGCASGRILKRAGLKLHGGQAWLSPQLAGHTHGYGSQFSAELSIPPEISSPLTQMKICPLCRPSHCGSR